MITQKAKKGQKLKKFVHKQNRSVIVTAPQKVHRHLVHSW